MIFTSLIIFAVSDRGLYANLPLYIAGSRPVSRHQNAQISALFKLYASLP